MLGQSLSSQSWHRVVHRTFLLNPFSVFLSFSFLASVVFLILHDHASSAFPKVNVLASHYASAR